MSRILVIGAKGLLGSHVVRALGEGQCIQASRSSSERVDISDPKSLIALFDRLEVLDGIVCTGGAARFKPWDQTTDEDWAFCLANKLMGQVNVVRWRGAESPLWRRDHPDHRGARAASDAGWSDGDDGQRGGRGLRARHSRRALERSRQRRLARLGGGDPSGHGSRSGARNPGLRGCTGLRAAIARRTVGFDCAVCSRLKARKRAWPASL